MEPAARPRIVTVGTTLAPGERGWDQLVATKGRQGPVRVDPESLAVLLYTSGTSGRPRAAMLSHRALLANIEQVAQVDPPMITGRDVVLGVLPLFHVYGLNAVLGQVLRQQARLVLVDGFDPEGSLDIIEDEAISVVPVAPPVFAYWMGVARPRGPARTGAAGAQRLGAARPGAHRRVHRAHPRRHPPGLRPDRGRAGGHLDAVQQGPDARARWAPRCPASRSGWSTTPATSRSDEDGGEIHIRGDNLFSGYWPDGVRRARTARAGGPPATSATSTPAATSTWSTGSRSW